MLLLKEEREKSKMSFSGFVGAKPKTKEERLKMLHEITTQIFFEEFTANPRSFVGDITNFLVDDIRNILDDVEYQRSETLLQDEADYLTKEMKERNMFANDTSFITHHPKTNGNRFQNVFR
jgi:hypothetical protein